MIQVVYFWVPSKFEVAVTFLSPLSRRFLIKIKRAMDCTRQSSLKNPDLNHLAYLSLIILNRPDGFLSLPAAHPRHLLAPALGKRGEEELPCLDSDHLFRG